VASRPLSLSAYRALSRRAAPVLPHDLPERPPGELVWIHLGAAEDHAAFADLAHRLIGQRPGLSVLMTGASGVLGRVPVGQGSGHLITAEPPDEHPDAVRFAMDHWAPDVLIWVWGGLRPNLVDEAAQRGVVLHLLSASPKGFDRPRDRWVPDLTRYVLRHFSQVTARDNEAVPTLVRLGVSARTIPIQPALQPSSRLLPAVGMDIDELTTHLVGRPTWLAANADPAEWPDIVTAHRQVLQSAHRLLLILHLSDPVLLPELCRMLEDQDLTFAVWGDGSWPEDATQVLIADIPQELGLWLRIATITFLGGSLHPAGGGQDPLPAALVGTAILYGPNVRAHHRAYARLTRAKAARLVEDGPALARAVSDLVAPEKAALMAHAGWDVVTQDAQIVDSIIALIQDSLDDQAAHHARRDRP